MQLTAYCIAKTVNCTLIDGLLEFVAVLDTDWFFSATETINLARLFPYTWLTLYIKVAASVAVQVKVGNVFMMAQYYGRI